jgi:hypothetical protein
VQNPRPKKMMPRMTSQKKKTLNNVVNTFDIQKNLIFFLLPTKNGFSLIHESNEFVLTNSEMYMSKGYLCDELLNSMLML